MQNNEAHMFAEMEMKARYTADDYLVRFAQFLILCDLVLFLFQGRTSLYASIFTIIGIFSGFTTFVLVYFQALINGKFAENLIQGMDTTNLIVKSKALLYTRHTTISVGILCFFAILLIAIPDFSK